MIIVFPFTGVKISKQVAQSAALTVINSHRNKGINDVPLTVGSDRLSCKQGN